MSQPPGELLPVSLSGTVTGFMRYCLAPFWAQCVSCRPPDTWANWDSSLLPAAGMGTQLVFDK